MDVYKSPVGQPKLKFENIPFEFTPDSNNRWVRLAGLVPWAELELLSGYRNHFGSTGSTGTPALPFRFESLIRWKGNIFGISSSTKQKIFGGGYSG